jgi:hypothetical protein
MPPPASNSLRPRAWNLFATLAKGTATMMSYRPDPLSFWRFSAASSAHPAR